MIKTFFSKIDESLDEASLKGNVGIPGEDGKGKKYLSDVEKRAEERNRELQRRHGQDIPRFMGLVAKAHQIQAGHEKELEKLAVEAIKTRYGSILDGVELDIKFPKKGGIADMMKDVQSKPEDPDQQTLKHLEEEGIISQIQKRKIANNITQGEAKNTKTCLNMEDVVEGFHKIFGREKGEEYRDLLNKITSIAGFFDWAIPMEVQQEMWERDKSGFAGSVKVEWETPEKPSEEEEEEDLAQKILKSLEEDDDLPKEETEELFNQTSPTIHALGTDFAMLIHEAVKGIYQLISANAIPEDAETAETVIMNTDSLADEIEDLRYGPEIAADLRDFINKFKESDEIENLREHVFGKMMLMEPKAFLDLMYKILNQDPAAKKPMQDIIDEVKKEISDYELSMAGIEPDEDSEEIAAIKAGATKEEPAGEEDYSELSPREIQAMVDKALDAGDFDKVRKLTPYLKESKKQGVFERMHSQMGYPSN